MIVGLSLFATCQLCLVWIMERHARIANSRYWNNFKLITPTLTLTAFVTSLVILMTFGGILKSISDYFWAFLGQVILLIFVVLVRKKVSPRAGVEPHLYQVVEVLRDIRQSLSVSLVDTSEIDRILSIAIELENRELNSFKNHLNRIDLEQRFPMPPDWSPEAVLNRKHHLAELIDELYRGLDDTSYRHRES